MGNLIQDEKYPELKPEKKLKEIAHAIYLIIELFIIKTKSYF
jgi:hypothetical protein